MAVSGQQDCGAQLWSDDLRDLGDGGGRSLGLLLAAAPAPELQGARGDPGTGFSAHQTLSSRALLFSLLTVECG